MRVRFLPSPSLASTVIRKALILLAGAVVWLSPLALSAQSVTFAGAQTTVANGLSSLQEIAADSAGDLFITEDDVGIVELPRTATGYGPPTLLPTSGLSYGADGIALDGAGDVFIADYYYGRVVELPRTANGYGPQITLLTGEPNNYEEVAADSAGDVFITYYIFAIPGQGGQPIGQGVVELPKTAAGYGSPINLSSNIVYGLAADGAGDVFFGASNVAELPRMGAGYGPLTLLPFSGLDVNFGIAVDSAGDVFVADAYYNRVVELPKTATGYGTQTTLPISGLNQPYGAAVDGAGDVFIADSANARVVELQTQSVSFGSANICLSGQTTPAPCSQTLTLTYNVTATGTLGTPNVLTGGGPDLDFTLASGSTCTGAVTAGATCTVNVTFTPLTTGVRNGSVEIVDGSGDVLATTAIYGSGLAVGTGSPVAEVSTNLLQFDPVAFGSSESQPLTIANSGGGTLIVTPSINGQSYTIASSNCGSGLTANESCTLQVEFSPISAGPHNDILTVLTNGSANPTVNLQGIGLGVSAGTEALQFGTIPLGTTEVLTVSFTNTATSGTAMLGAVTTSPSYTILNTAQNTCQAGVAAGHSCTLPIQFSPVVVGPHNDDLNLTLSADGPPTAVVSLNGFAGGVGTELAMPLNFGTLPAYTTAVLPLTITNFGVPGTVTIGTAINGPSFKVLTTTENTCLAGISAGQSCTLPVEFLANSVGTHNELLTLTPSGGAANSVVHLDAVEAAP